MYLLTSCVSILLTYQALDRLFTFAAAPVHVTHVDFFFVVCAFNPLVGRSGERKENNEERLLHKKMKTNLQ